MTQTLTPAQTARPTQTTTTPASKDTHMSHHRSPITRALTYAAYFLGLLLLVAAWTVYGPSYDAQALPSTAASTSSQAASEPCPAGEATGGTCGTEGALTSPSDTSTSAPTDPASPTPQRRCKGCRLSQEEYDARQADKQAAHDRAEARKQRGAERRAEADRRREERAARKASKSSSSHHKTSHSSSGGSSAASPTDTTADTSQAAQDAPEASSDDVSSTDGGSPSDGTNSPAASAPYTPLEIPEASRKPAPYDASKDPFEVRREAARQAADAVNHASNQTKTPAAAPTAPATSALPSNGYWAEQLPTWALALIGFLAAAGIFTYKVSRPRTSHLGDRRS